MLKAVIPSYKCVEELEGTPSCYNVRGHYQPRTSKSYYVYTVHVHLGSHRVQVLDRRYSDFLQLHRQLRRSYDTPEFPPKRVRNATVKVLETRRSSLEYYLQSMLRLSPVPKELITFLNLSQHYRLQNLPQPFEDRVSNWSAFGLHGLGWSVPTTSVGLGGGTGGDSYHHHYGGSIVGLRKEEACGGPAAGFTEDPFLVESDSSSTISDCVTRGVLDALYQTDSSDIL